MARNVLLLTLDQWRGDALSAAGHPVVTTPVLDGLAAEGVRFGSHFAQATPCGPSRASLLTGQYLFNHRSVLNGTPLDRRFTNLALEARALGYDPLLLGYTDTSPDPRDLEPGDPRLRTYQGVLPGFRRVVDIPDDYGDWFAWLADHGYDLPARVDDIWNGVDGDASPATPSALPAVHGVTAFLTARLVDRLTDLAEASGPGSPGWFVHATYIRPHPPFKAHPEHFGLVDPADVPLPDRAPSVEAEGALHPFLRAALDLGFVRAPEDEADLRRLRATYYAMVAEVDESLGRVFDALRATSQWDDTLVVVTSDHGDELGDHWLTGKLGWFDGSYHVPLIVRDPRSEADPARGRVVDEFTENVDVMPTVLDWLGVDELPLQCDGRSLTPFLRGLEPTQWREEAHWEFDFRIPQLERHPLGLRMDQCQLAVLRGRTYKYVHCAGLPSVYYDLRTDPGELVDRSGDPALRDAVLEAAERMLSWRMEHTERGLSGVLVGGERPFEGRDRLR